MNRAILKHGYPITAVILAIFGWVVYRRIARGWSEVILLAGTAAIVWALGTPAFIYIWPRLTVNGYRRAITRRGFSGGPIPVNTLYAEPRIPSASAPSASLLATGTDDLLYVAGWLDLREGPQVLHVPDAGGRYYSLQFTDPSTGANFAYVGTRTTGTTAGDYVLVGPRWNGTLPTGMTRISAPHRSALVIGRVFVADANDQPAAYGLAQQIQLTPLYT